MNEAFKARHDYVVHALNCLPGISCLPGAGTFYAFADVSRAITGPRAVGDDNEFAELLLNEGGVAVVPGSGFGAPATFASPSPAACRRWRRRWSG